MLENVLWFVWLGYVLFFVIIFSHNLGPGDPYMRLWTMSSLVQIMALSLGRRQAIIWSNADLLSIRPPMNIFRWNFIYISSIFEYLRHVDFTMGSVSFWKIWKYIAFLNILQYWESACNWKISKWNLPKVIPWLVMIWRHQWPILLKSIS